jgi:hypothetical protein
VRTAGLEPALVRFLKPLPLPLGYVRAWRKTGDSNTTPSSGASRLAGGRRGPPGFVFRGARGPIRTDTGPGLGRPPDRQKLAAQPMICAPAGGTGPSFRRSGIRVRLSTGAFLLSAARLTGPNGGRTNRVLTRRLRRSTTSARAPQNQARAEGKGVRCGSKTARY